MGTLARGMELADFLVRCKEKLGTKGIRYVDGGKPVRRIAVMGGSGGDEFLIALENKIQRLQQAFPELECRVSRVHGPVISFF